MFVSTGRHGLPPDMNDKLNENPYRMHPPGLPPPCPCSPRNDSPHGSPSRSATPPTPPADLSNGNTPSDLSVPKKIHSEQNINVMKTMNSA